VPISQKRLEATVAALRSRPGHENVRGLIRELFVVGLDISGQEVNFEVRVPEVGAASTLYLAAQYSSSSATCVSNRPTPKKA
jgi:hypothetical protein